MNLEINVSLLAVASQDWHHVGCRWRLRLGWHDGRGAPCGGAAPQAYGQPVEQSAVLNLDPEPAVHAQVCLILPCRSTHTCGFYWTEPWQKMSLAVSLTDPCHSLSKVLAPTQVLSVQSRVSVTHESGVNVVSRVASQDCCMELVWINQICMPNWDIQLAFT